MPKESPQTPIRNKGACGLCCSKAVCVLCCESRPSGRYHGGMGHIMGMPALGNRVFDHVRIDGLKCCSIVVTVSIHVSFLDRKANGGEVVYHGPEIC